MTSPAAWSNQTGTLGSLYRSSGEPGIASGYLDKCILHGQDLAERATNRVSWQTQVLLPCLQLKARLQPDAGEFDDAPGLLDLVRSQIEALGETSGESLEIELARGREHLILGDIRKQLGHTEQARGGWSAAVAALAPYSEKLDPEQLIILATGLARLGATEDARSALEKLRAIGYRHPDFIALWTAVSQNPLDELRSEGTQR